MTLLNFILAEEAVYLVADTVVSDSMDKSPVSFTTKVYPVPHWDGLICGTGIMNFVVNWYCTAITSVLATDLKHLDQFAPEQLRSLFEKYEEEYEGHELRSTIYHLGFDQQSACFFGFAYRSTDNFVSEPLAYGMRLKPDPEDTSIQQISTFPDDFIPIAELQKKKDELKPVNDRVGIGGRLISYMMQRIDIGDGKHRVKISISDFYNFQDAQAAYLLASSKLPENN